MRAGGMKKLSHHDYGNEYCNFFPTLALAAAASRRSRSVRSLGRETRMGGVGLQDKFLLSSWHSGSGR